MTDADLLGKVKLSCRIASNVTAFDDELKDLIKAAFLDLSISDVNAPGGQPYSASTATEDIVLAVKTFVKINFGDLYENKEDLKASYWEQKAQLKMKRYSEVIP